MTTLTDQSPRTIGNMSVVESACRYAADRSNGIIVIENANRDFPRAIDELQSANARHLAVGYATTQGIPDARVNGNLIGPYAVNADNIPLDKVAESQGRPVPPNDPQMQPAKYRVEVPVCRKLI